MELASIIKYEGDNSTFIWKHPCEDFNTTTQLIVHESQEAVFYMNGQILDRFEAGRYTLETQNIPLIGKFYNKVFGDKTPFHCEVYFINKTEQMAVKWGTDSKVEYIDPIYKFPIQLGASGEMTLRVEDACKLLVKIVGTEHNLSQASIVQKFRAFLMTKFKTYMANYIKTNNINVFEIDENLQQISNNLQEILVPDFSEYGVSLVHFFITTIVKPEGNEQYARFKELHYRQYTDIAEAKLKQQTEIINAETEAQKKVIDSKAEATKREQEGYTYQQERGFDVAEKVASNEAVGEMSNLGIGLGVMGAVGGTVSGVVTNSMNGALEQINEASKKCPKCGTNLPNNAKFCLECGSKLENKCPKCGAITSVDAKFCLECGEKLGGQKDEQ